MSKCTMASTDFKADDVFDDETDPNFSDKEWNRLKDSLTKVSHFASTKYSFLINRSDLTLSFTFAGRPSRWCQRRAGAGLAGCLWPWVSPRSFPGARHGPAEGLLEVRGDHIHNVVSNFEPRDDFQNYILMTKISFFQCTGGIQNDWWTNDHFWYTIWETEGFVGERLTTGGTILQDNTHGQ